MNRWLLAGASTALLAIASRPWPGTSYLALVGVVPLLFALRGERRALPAFGYAALAWSGAGWVLYEGALVVEPWSFPVLLIGSSALWGVAAVGAVALARRWGAGVAVAAFPALVVAVEYAAAQPAFFGALSFVGSIGYMHLDSPLVAMAAWSGLSGVGFATLAVNAAVAGALRSARPLPAGVLVVATAAAFAAFALAPVPGGGPVEDGSTVRVGLVQGAVPRVDVQMAFLDPGASARVLEVFADLTRAAVAAGAEWVVWGETVVPFDLVDGRIDGVVAEALAPAPFALVGARERAGRERYNAILGWSGGVLASVYRKNVLVPFVEDVFDAGTPVPPLAFDGVRVALGICLESLYAARARAAVADGADVLVYLSDDTFAGRTVTPVVHVANAAFRAAETGRAVVFANESGPSAVFDARGRRIAGLGVGTSDALVVDVPLASGTTPFVRLGDWVGRLAFSFAVAACATAALPARLRGAVRRRPPPP